MNCCLCGGDIKSRRCPHRWDLPFDEWPQRDLEIVFQRAPKGFDPDPPKPA